MLCGYGRETKGYGYGAGLAVMGYGGDTRCCAVMAGTLRVMAGTLGIMAGTLGVMLCFTVSTARVTTVILGEVGSTSSFLLV